MIKDEGFKIVKKEDREKSESLSIAQQTVAELQKINESFEASDLTSKEYFENLSTTIKDSIEKLSEIVQNQPEIKVDTVSLESLLSNALTQLLSQVTEIKEACENIKVDSPIVNNEITPEIKLKSPPVIVDLTKMEDLLKSELPRIFDVLLKSIPTTDAIDLTKLEVKFDKAIELLQKLVEKKMPMLVGGGGGGGNVPLVNTPTGVAVPVANPDGSNIAGGGGGGGDASAANQATQITEAQSANTKLDAIIANTDALEGFTDQIEPILANLLLAVDGLEATLSDVDLNTDEIEAKLEDVKTKLDTANASLASIAAEDFATETTLVAVRNAVDALESLIGTSNTLLTSISAEDFATETTLASVLAAVDGIETLIASTNTKLDTLNAELASFTQTTGDPVGAIDKGVATLAKYEEEATHTVHADGDYEGMSVTGWKELRTRDQRSSSLQDCNDFTEFTILGNDTANLANTTQHVFGTGAITFDKVNGAADTVYAGASFTVPNKDISEIFEDGGFVALAAYLPSLSNVEAVGIRLGTDASNYNYWEWASSDLTASSWLALRRATAQPSGSQGNGWNTGNIAYGAVYVRFNSQSNTLAGIRIDNIHFVGGRVTDTTLDASISSSVSTPNVNVARVGGTQTDTNAGNASAGTQRTIEAADSPVVSGIAAVDTTLGTPRQEDGHGSLRTDPSHTQEVTKQDLIPYAEQLVASTVITPSAGKRIQLVWAQVIADPDGSAGNLVTIALTISTVLTNIYKVYAVGRSAVFTGDVDEDLVITLENAQPVTVNLQYREI